MFWNFLCSTSHYNNSLCVYLRYIKYSPRSNKWLICFMFPLPPPHENPVGICLFPIRATCSALLILSDFITWIIFVDVWKLWTSSLDSFLQSPVNLLLVRRRYLPQHSILERPHPMLFPECEKVSKASKLQNKFTTLKYSLKFMYL